MPLATAWRRGGVAGVSPLLHRPTAVTALSRIFLDGIERLLGGSGGVVHDAGSQPTNRPRLGAVSFLHRFGSALNRYVHLHACVTDGLFRPVQEGAAFLPARPVTPADMLAWQNSGFSIDASVRVALLDRDVPSY